LAEEAGLPRGVFGCPVNGGEITSHFGEPRSYEIHPGVNIKPTTNDWRVFAVDSGEIIYVGCRRGSCQVGCGYEVVIKHDNGYTTRYCHLNPQKTSEILDNKKRVERGDPIGIIDNTGDSHGNHLHFEVKDPQGRLQSPENFIAHCGYPEKPGIWKPK
jgi:murein DD-endopeptidase MepM/ murein hydrolase activator NlpD